MAHRAPVAWIVRRPGGDALAVAEDLPFVDNAYGRHGLAQQLLCRSGSTRQPCELERVVVWVGEPGDACARGRGPDALLVLLS
jgi:hypothetical protein